MLLFLEIIIFKLNIILSSNLNIFKVNSLSDSMNVNVLRLDHRLKRDTRITTHVCLTARAFGASKIYLAGERDNHLMDNVRDTASRFGGNFEIEYTESYMGVINKWKADGGKVVHLTMYGSQAHEIAPEVRQDGSDILIILFLHELYFLVHIIYNQIFHLIKSMSTMKYFSLCHIEAFHNYKIYSTI